MRSKGPFWRDRALVELCAAVLHSFRKAGVTIVDHHAASPVFHRSYDPRPRLPDFVPRAAKL